MEITSFILGVCAVIVVAMVVGTFVNYMSVKQLKEQVDYLNRDTHNEIEVLNQNLDKQEHNLTDYVDTLHNKSENDINELYRYIDSRFDKMENKFRGDIASGVEVRKVIDFNEKVTKRLDEFISTYQNQ